MVDFGVTRDDAEPKARGGVERGGGGVWEKG